MPPPTRRSWVGSLPACARTCRLTPPSGPAAAAGRSDPPRGARVGDGRSATGVRARSGRPPGRRLLARSRASRCVCVCVCVFVKGPPYSPPPPARLCSYGPAAAADHGPRTTPRAACAPSAPSRSAAAAGRAAVRWYTPPVPDRAAGRRGAAAEVPSSTAGPARQRPLAGPQPLHPLSPPARLGRRPDPPHTPGPGALSGGGGMGRRGVSRPAALSPTKPLTDTCERLSRARGGVRGGRWVCGGRVPFLSRASTACPRPCA